MVHSLGDLHLKHDNNVYIYNIYIYIIIYIYIYIIAMVSQYTTQLHMQSSKSGYQLTRLMRMGTSDVDSDGEILIACCISNDSQSQIFSFVHHNVLRWK